MTGGGKLTLIHGNAQQLPLADQSVHLIVTSPPYWALRSYRDGDAHYTGQLGSEPTPHHFLANLWQVLDECWRVLRDDGSCWINLGDKMSGSGGHNNNGISRHGLGASTLMHDGRPNPQPTSERAVAINETTKATRRQAPDRYNQNTGSVRPKSRMLLPHRFALGLIDPDYRRFVIRQAGLPDPLAVLPQWICRMDAVWSKPNGLPESVTDRVRASHEYWFHFTKSERYYSATDAIREDYAERYADRVAIYGHRQPETTRTYAPGDRNDAANHRGILGLNPTGTLNALGKLPGSVWTIPTEPLTLPADLPQHFAAFPSEFPRRIVLGWSPSGVCVRCGEGRRPVCERDYEKRAIHSMDAGRKTVERLAAGNGNAGSVGYGGGFMGAMRITITGTACACPTPDAPTTPARVLDPFSGTGTAPIVAAALGRHGIGVDLSWDYHRIARWRDRDGGLRAKALGVAKPARQLGGQESLFDGAA
jgi:hypothetical protein